MTDQRSSYDKATDVLAEAWDAISDPPGQALEAEGNRVPWAATAAGVGIGYALLALYEELRQRG